MFTCPKCGNVADPGTIYCDGCGFRLKQAASQPPAAAQKPGAAQPQPIKR